MKKILLAFQFLTIIPVKEPAQVSEKELGGASAFFPLVGAFQGLLLVGAEVISTGIFPPELINGLLILVLVLSNGGLHLDGLADTFDAIAVKGDREKKLAIMKDSAIGPIGVISIVLTLLLKFLAINSLYHFSFFTFHFSLFLMPVFSRWVMVPVIFHGKSARHDGLGKIFIENTGLKEVLTATFFTILFSLFVVLINIKITGSVFHFLIPLLTLYLFGLLSVWFFNKRFGGLTGDTLGAVSEISEILFLLSVLVSSNAVTT